MNLSPADLPKEGARFDLPIALGLLAASGQIDAELLSHLECAGELGLSGELRPVKGALAMALALRAAKLERELILPRGCADEAALVQGLVVREAAHLLDLVNALQPRSDAPLPRVQRDPPPAVDTPLDLRDIKGQAGPKRALEIAAAGGLSVLLVGPPGTGKSMLAQRLPTLLPPLSESEALESAALLSANGQFRPSLWAQRAFRSPHHSASAAALIGGGSPPRPGGQRHSCVQRCSYIDQRVTNVTITVKPKARSKLRPKMFGPPMGKFLDLKGQLPESKERALWSNFLHLL